MDKNGTEGADGAVRAIKEAADKVASGPASQSSGYFCVYQVCRVSVYLFYIYFIYQIKNKIYTDLRQKRTIKMEWRSRRT